MVLLIRLTREGSTPEIWDEHFKTILLLLLETLGDNSVSFHNFFIQENCLLLQTSRYLWKTHSKC